MSRDDRWVHLVNAAFRLDETRAAVPEERLRAAAAALASATEVFSASIEPSEDFEGYAVRRLLLALGDVLDGRHQRPLEHVLQH